nr:MAG TPA: hypothetical protein [Caudoviricetes sp.]
MFYIIQYDKLTQKHTNKQIFFYFSLIFSHYFF